METSTRADPLDVAWSSRKIEKSSYQNAAGVKSESFPQISLQCLSEKGRSAGCAIL